jgi:D-tyrosyl-tRNA(Tyr) deacylase
MKLLVQRVTSARLEVEQDGQRVNVGTIGPGLVVYTGIEKGDASVVVETLAAKLTTLRIFEDEQGKMNRSVVDIGGSVMVIPNFTLAGNTRKGTRPSFDNAMAPAQARPMFEMFVRLVAGSGRPVVPGVFGASMFINQENAGPVSILING